MRLSQYPLTTLKETPAGAEIVSHQLMLRAGLIHRLASGLYSWMPMGLRVARKVEQVVREEMDLAGGLELLMPMVQPGELWRESGRWSKYGPELLRLSDRHEREFCLGPTHEEVITDIARRDLRSYRQLPVTWYQIQTKFRDEIRPRFGVMRAREFIMKDAYSFHLDAESMQATYDRMHEAYTRIFQRLGLDFRPVQADPGAIGGSFSHEFHVLAESGEDAIAYSEGGYAANVELAAALPPAGRRPAPGADIARVATPSARTIPELTACLDVAAEDCLKTLIVEGTEGPVALVLRGDHDLNAVKAEKLEGVEKPLSFAADETIRSLAGASAGSVGPVGLDCRIHVDAAAAAASDFVCGANEDGFHLTGVNWGRDLPEPEPADLRNVVAGDPAPDGSGPLAIARGIEVGHIFQLGSDYSAAMGATVLDAEGQEQTMLMGCYGIGVTRVVAAAIEQNFDDNGIIWPEPIAPYDLVIVPINMDRSDAVRDLAESLYAELGAAGVDVLFDDRDLRPGVKFADAELLGIPHRLVVGDRGIKAGTLEYRHRRAAEAESLPASGARDELVRRIAAGKARYAT